MGNDATINKSKVSEFEFPEKLWNVIQASDPQLILKINIKK
ncbi:hypothetical protein FORC60_0860 [Bacillus cereus]|nr:hypothetical protein FORC60_0860 [Bacillus cereus]